MQFLSISHLTKTYENGARPAVENLHFQLDEGEFLTILGPSGCGKTTTLRLLAGFETPDKGDIYFKGKNLTPGKSIIPPEKRNIGLVFQDFALFPHLSVEGNILFGLKLKKVSKAASRCREVLKLFRLTPLKDHFPHQLSGGEAQRVALARSLAPRPDLLLFDEPFSNLDPQLKNELRQEIKEILKKEGMGTIFVTHDHNEALAMSDRLLILNGGKAQQIGPPSHLYHRPHNNFVATFLGDTNIFEGKVRDFKEGGMLYLDTQLGPLSFKHDPQNITFATGQFRPNTTLYLSLRPQYIVEKSSPHEALLSGMILEKEFSGLYSKFLVSLQGAKPLKLNIILTNPLKNYRVGDSLFFDIMADKACLLAP